MPIAPRSATILGVQAAQTTTTGELPLTESHACASGLAHAYRRAQPHGFVRNRWYLAANRDARVEWDFEDRLVKVTKADGTVVENTYDVDGVLVRTSVNGVGTDYLVDTSGGLSHVVAEIDGSGAVSVLYVRAGDMLLEEVRGGVAKMYEADGLGSVRGLLDATGARTDTYAYEAFGSTVSTTGNDLNPYRFAGERLVDSVGMYQNRARWLDTRTGRFVSVDRAEGKALSPITLGPYLYGGADPVNYTDPTGREFDLASMMASITISSVLAVVTNVGTASAAKNVERGVVNRAGGDAPIVSSALYAIRTSRNVDTGARTMAAFQLLRLEGENRPTIIRVDPSLLYGEPFEKRDAKGNVLSVTVLIGKLGLAQGPNRYPDGSIARWDTMMCHELAHTYGFMFENSVGLSEERALNVENEYRASQGYEQSNR